MTTPETDPPFGSRSSLTQQCWAANGGVPQIRIERGLALAECERLQSGEPVAETGAAQGDRRPVADAPAAAAGEEVVGWRNTPATFIGCGWPKAAWRAGCVGRCCGGLSRCPCRRVAPPALERSRERERRRLGCPRNHAGEGPQRRSIPLPGRAGSAESPACAWTTRMRLPARRLALYYNPGGRRNGGPGQGTQIQGD